jgi:hypothetical protein
MRGSGRPAAGTVGLERGGAGGAEWSGAHLGLGWELVWLDQLPCNGSARAVYAEGRLYAEGGPRHRIFFFLLFPLFFGFFLTFFSLV